MNKARQNSSQGKRPERGLKDKKPYKNKPRPYTVESRYMVGDNSTNWRFFKKYATPAAALEAAETVIGRANFVEFRCIFKGVEQWIK